ncbi:MAG: pyridoxal 5'-phosphate synthase glutaminase subunit PdxT [Candidatus Nanopelagicaceae bacterium]|nr:pyridoxal 5'-phosphate synthase glutaminase subunit PdxT [Candidatus Nanopelagicaceae bacterium]
MLALQGDVREHFFAIENCEAIAIEVKRPSDLDGIDGLIIPGGESTTIVKLLRIFDLFEPLQKALQNGLPVYGSCAGMILLANKIIDGTSDQETLGVIDITVKRNAFGRQVDSFEQELLIPEIDVEPFNVIFIRAPWIEKMGADVKSLADLTTTNGLTHSVLARSKSVLVSSFHPELTGDLRVHRYFIDKIC